MKTLRAISALLLLFYTASCSDDEFTRSTVNQSVKVEPIKIEVRESCSNFSPPPVDILLLVDNSFSPQFLQVDLRAALQSLVVSAANLPDYRIYIAPLIPPSGETEGDLISFQLVTNNPSNVPTSANVVGINQVNLSFPTLNFSTERGFIRAAEILEKNLGTVFRKNAFTMVVTLSNGDDNDEEFLPSSGQMVPSQPRFSDVHKPRLLEVKNELAALQFRYISVVNHFSEQNCSTNIRFAGHRYRRMSSEIYQSQSLSDAQGSHPDSYDLCQGDLGKIFKDLAATIDSFQKGHTYHYWPVQIAENEGDLNFDPDKLQVYRQRPSGSQQSIASGAVDGFTYEGFKSNHNIRLDPLGSLISPAEKYTGFFIKLNGNAKVEFPDCVVVRTEDFDKFYGYIVLPNEPDPSTLEVYIKGEVVDKKGVNRWEYLGFKESQNVLVVSRSDLSSKTPGIFRTGYVIKLFGNAIYNDGAKVEVFYKSQPIN